MPYEERTLEMDVPIGMDANAVIVMAPANGFQLESDGLVESGTQDFEGVTYNMFTGNALKAGTSLALSLSGHPKSIPNIITSEGDSTNTLVVGLAGFGLALIGAGIYLWRRNREDDLFDEVYDDELLADTKTAEDIMDAIIALDDQYKLDGLPEDAYQARRAELKERLRKRVN